MDRFAFYFQGAPCLFLANRAKKRLDREKRWTNPTSKLDFSKNCTLLFGQQCKKADNRGIIGEDFLRVHAPLKDGCKYGAWRDAFPEFRLRVTKVFEGPLSLKPNQNLKNNKIKHHFPYQSTSMSYSVRVQYEAHCHCVIGFDSIEGQQSTSGILHRGSDLCHPKRCMTARMACMFQYLLDMPIIAGGGVYAEHRSTR